MCIKHTTVLVKNMDELDDAIFVATNADVKKAFVNQVLLQFPKHNLITAKPKSLK